ncbi:MAG: hypothetical protein AAF570_27545 [Bacteroidota bacterium]
MGPGKSGKHPKTFVNENKFKVGQITIEQRKALFEIAYAEKQTAAKGRATKPADYGGTSNSANTLTQEEWAALPQKLKDFIFDLTFQGAYSNGAAYFTYARVNPILKSTDSDEEKIAKIRALTLGSSHTAGGEARMNYRIKLLDGSIYDPSKFFDESDLKGQAVAATTETNAEIKAPDTGTTPPSTETASTGDDASITEIELKAGETGPSTTDSDDGAAPILDPSEIDTKALGEAAVEEVQSGPNNSGPHNQTDAEADALLKLQQEAAGHFFGHANIGCVQ